MPLAIDIAGARLAFPSVQERLLDENGQMWMSFKERLMYWERQAQLINASEYPS